jgi:hypothetical protein
MLTRGALSSDAKELFLEQEEEKQKRTKAMKTRKKDIRVSLS